MSSNVLNLDVPSLLSVEYPLRVRDTQRAIEMIGGTDKLKKCFIEPDMKLELRLRKSDPRSHPIHSTVLKNSENLLLKFKIPKRILKLFDYDIRQSIDYCETNNIKYFMEPYGILKQNYKFRELADFQILNRGSKFNKKFDESIRDGHFDKINEFSKELEDGMNNKTQVFSDGDLDLPSLVRYSRSDISHSYKFFGNLLLDEQGEWLNKAVKLYTIQIKWNDKIPQGYDPQLDKEYEKALADIERLKVHPTAKSLLNEAASYNLIKCIKICKKLFELKPVWTRKNIYYMLPRSRRAQLRFALPFVAYTFANGPWRHLFIKIGYDPKSDPSSFIYQIEAFRGPAKLLTDEDIEKLLENNEIRDQNLILPPTLKKYESEFDDPNSEIGELEISKIPKQLFFDGINPCSALSFQIGDIIDEDIVNLLKNSKVEEKCTLATGWLSWITLCRIRSIIKYKLACLKDNEPIKSEKIDDLKTRTTFTKNMTVSYFKDENGQGKVQETELNDDGSENENENEEFEDNESERNEDDDDDDDIPNDDLIQRIQKLNPKSLNIIEELETLLKQDVIMKDNLQESNNATIV